MEKEIKLYNDLNLITFSINIKQKYNEKQQKWKKDLTMPLGWQKLTEPKYVKGYNGVGLLTGKINDIIVIDIDNVNHWNQFLFDNKQTEPNTVKAESGSGGIHLYFKYPKDFDNITSTDHKFGKQYDIDLKTNGGCIIIPPSTYFNKNFDKDVSYEWVKSILDYDPNEMPQWIIDLIKNPITKTKKPKETKGKKTPEKKSKLFDNSSFDSNSNSNSNSDSDNEDKPTNNSEFTGDEIEQLVDMLSIKRADGYSDWINVGMCLYNLKKDDCKYFWKNFSKKSNKYDQKEVIEKWKSFSENINGFGIGSLLKWAKEDNPCEYKKFMDDKKLCRIIMEKYPKEKLLLGPVLTVSEVCKCIKLHNKDCLIKGGPHDREKTNFIETTRDCIALKCNHDDCFGKLLHKQLYMTKNEMNMIFNGNVNINFNDNHSAGTENDIYDIEKISIFDDTDLNDLAYAGLYNTSTRYANILYYLNKGKYVYTENDSWYSFCEKWEKEGKRNSDFRKTIDGQLENIYSQMAKKYLEIEGKSSKTFKYIKQLIVKFGDTILKNNIVTEAACIFSDKTFLSNLDANYNLIGFDNGAYDLNKFEFRKGVPEDYISMSVGYNYNSIHTDKYNDLQVFLNDIMPDDNEREYMLTYLAICLIGNQFELFTILTGNGRNGKSKLVELLGLTFGDYFEAVQSQLFTRPRPDANSPDPGLLNLQKKRIVIASEPEKNNKLNSGFIKFVTGRDSTTLRNCHSNDMIKFVPKFATFLICNDIPECDDIDNAFSKRLRCINFPTEFVDEPKKDNQKKLNTKINESFEYWKLDFMLLLIEYYKKYTYANKLVPTENILKWTNQYKENTDIYLQFLNEKTEYSESSNVHCSELYETFKIWFKNNNPHTKIPSNKEFVLNLRKHKEICKVSVDNKSQLGIRNLQIM
jgi:P4 family phage/plasmid primase-like protien